MKNLLALILDRQSNLRCTRALLFANLSRVTFNAFARASCKVNLFSLLSTYVRI
jgi:hypothetical protein